MNVFIAISLFCLFILFVAIGIAWMMQQQRQYEREVLEGFELRERMSNANFQASITHSLSLMKDKNHGK